MKLLAILGLLTALMLNLSNVMADSGFDMADHVDALERNTEYKARDQYRHPLETLRFFEIEPDMTVVEIWPAPGYYTEILAPMLKGNGRYIAAGFGSTANRTPQWRKDRQAAYNAWVKANASLFGAVDITELAIPERTDIGPEMGADRVLTFRNVHNWIKGNYEQDMFAVFFKALKPGGLLGVVEHRAAKGTSLDAMKLSGYVTEDYVRQLAKQAGFEFVGKSEINANSKDTKDHPEGVWTLPPSLRLGAVDREKYSAIGESDRMTLKFRKP